MRDDIGHDSLRLVAAYVRNDYRCALFRETPRDSAADLASTACNDGNASFKQKLSGHTPPWNLRNIEAGEKDKVKAVSKRRSGPIMAGSYRNDVLKSRPKE
jgi:hypothetical protein